MGEEIMEYVWMFLAGSVALVKGRRVFGWMIAGLIFNFLAVIVVMLLSENKEKVALREELGRSLAGKYLASRELKDINTPNDLISQLETK
jgi:hypothetical protein